MNQRGLPRTVDALLALVGLCASAPLLAVSALAVAASSAGPILFRQKRVGRGGRAFELIKFRTMRVSKGGAAVTARGDDRITRIGRLLRLTKLDEFPALWNVLKGDMSLVGPRPEVPRYVDLDDQLWREVLSTRPGLTDPTTLRLRNEEEVLAQVDGDRDAFYRRTLLRYKLLCSAAYLRRRTWRSDVRILVDTAVAVVLPRRAPPPSVAEIERQVAEAGELTELGCRSGE